MKRIYYIDNLRIFLISLVVLHHLAITYGGPGGWYYVENEADSFSIFPFTLFLASNQSFFMGLFFLISAYFTEMSLRRKPLRIFIKDRLLRLGIPLVFFYFFLSPVTVFVVLKYSNGEDIQFSEFFMEHRGLGFGPMWFVEALIFFNFFYLIFRYLFMKKDNPAITIKNLPQPFLILLSALGVGGIGFLIRTRLPLGWELEPFAFQIPFFTQYIFLYIIGIIAYRQHWIETISFKLAVRWLLFAQFLILGIFPIVMVYGTGPNGNIDSFAGGWTWQSLSYSLWEQMTGFSLMIGLVGIFKQKFNTQNKLLQRLSVSAYAVYIIHPLVLVSLTAAFKNLEIYHFIKFLLLAPIALLVCFLIGNLLTKIPQINRII